jgi:transposase-like protein
MTKGSLVPGSIPPAREGHRRRFSATDKSQILEEAIRPGARLSEVARRYGIAGRVLFRWKQEMMPAAAPTFVAVEITDADQERAS